MYRTVRIGDFARVVLDNETQTYPIELIEGNTIYLSVEEGKSSILILVNGEYKVKGLNVNHRVEFIPNDSPILTGDPNLDLVLLEELDDTDLETLCQVDGYIKELCEGDQLWINKVVNKFGQTILEQRAPDMSFKDYYTMVNNFYSTKGANLALARNDQQLFDRITSMGYQPDINIIGNWIPFAVGQDRPYQPNAPLTVLRFSETVMKFFREAELGPQVMGDFSQGKQNPESLTKVEGTRLNDILWFIHPTINGQPNPLYGLVVNEYNILGRLLTLHDYYGDPKQKGVRGASSSMRKYFAPVMRTLIDEDVDSIINDHPEHAELAREKAELAKKAIDDPTLVFNHEVIPGKRIFNPNNILATRPRLWPYLVYGGTITFNQDERERIAQVYSIIPNITPDNALSLVNIIYSRVINMAEGYKIKLMMEAQRKV